MKMDEKFSAFGSPTRGFAPDPAGGLPLDPRYRLSLHALAMVCPPWQILESAPAYEGNTIVIIVIFYL